MHYGSCLCGAVEIRVDGDLNAPDGCHCSQCRKQSGHYFSGTDVDRKALSIEGGEHVTWYHSSEKVRRGFCSICGSTLFWDPLHRDWTGVAMGVFDGPTGVTLAKHIFVADKGDYYEIADGMPQNAQ